jgi:hypothetical protein
MAQRGAAQHGAAKVRSACSLIDMLYAMSKESRAVTGYVLDHITSHCVVALASWRNPVWSTSVPVAIKARQA